METQTVNISLPKKLLKTADSFAKSEFRTRSELFREAIRNYLLRELRLKAIFAYGEQQAKKFKIKESDLERLIDEYRKGR